MKEQRVSYSALADLDKCSMKFYLGRILGLPQKTFAKTTIGSMIHAILECLARPKHRHHFDVITAGGKVNHKQSAAIDRMVRCWQVKHKLPDDLIAETDEMLTVALIKTDFFFAGAAKVYAPEHEFIVVVNGARLKGFIDSMADMGDHFIVRDWKTSAQKMSKADVQNSYQTRMYQWYVRRTFGKPAVVEYVFLRHGPTTRTPEKHIMRVQPSSPEMEAGFEYYATSMYKPLNEFGLREAHANFSTDFGFCERVCSYRNGPLRYYELRDTVTGDLLSTHMLDNVPNLGHNQVLVEMTHAGCPKYN